MLEPLRSTRRDENNNPSDHETTLGCLPVWSGRWPNKLHCNHIIPHMPITTLESYFYDRTKLAPTRKDIFQQNQTSLPIPSRWHQFCSILFLYWKVIEYANHDLDIKQLSTEPRLDATNPATDRSRWRRKVTNNSSVLLLLVSTVGGVWCPRGNHYGHSSVDLLLYSTQHCAVQDGKFRVPLCCAQQFRPTVLFFVAKLIIQNRPSNQGSVSPCDFEWRIDWKIYDRGPAKIGFKFHAIVAVRLYDATQLEG